MSVHLESGSIMFVNESVRQNPIVSNHKMLSFIVETIIVDHEGNCVHFARKS